MIELKNVSCQYSDIVWQVDDISLILQKGQCVVLSGPSGCGKTTMTRLLNRLIPDLYQASVKGDVLIDGKCIRTWNKGEVALYQGNVFQDPKSQFFSTIVSDEIALIGENLGMEHGLLQERVNNAADICGISHLLHRSVHELSGGEKQKVAIASTLVWNAPIIILDEPSANLDMRSTLELGELLKKLKKEGKTIIVAEHRLFYLNEIMDRLIVMEKGKIVGDYYNPSNNHIVKHTLRPLDYTSWLKVISAKHCFGEIKSNKIILSINELKVGIDKQVLLSNISFSLHEGERMAVIGKNGIGKTTLLNVISGLNSPISGKISSGNNKQRLASSYYMLQDCDSQLFFVSVEMELLTGQKNNEEVMNKAKQYLCDLDLWDLRTSHPQECSGGEKQRICVAVSLLQDVQLLLLDEPTAGLDYKRMQQLSTSLNNGKSQLIITHDVEFILQLCHSVLVLDTTGCFVMSVNGNEAKIVDYLKQ